MCARALAAASAVAALIPIGAAAAAGPVPGITAGAPGASGPALAGPRVLGWGFGDPGGIVSSGAYVFVSNRLGNGSVIELNAVTGAMVRFISGNLVRPGPMAVGAGDLFVGDEAAVTEISIATGALVRVITARDDFVPEDQGAIAIDGAYLFTANDAVNAGDEGSVDQFRVSTGALVRQIAGPAYHFDQPGSLAVVGHDLFVTNTKGNSVTELDATTGVPVRVISARRYRFDNPGPIVAAGDDLFVADSGSGCEGRGGPGSITELDARTGAVVGVISGPDGLHESFGAMALDGHRLFVASTNLQGSIEDDEEICQAMGGAVTEIGTGTGQTTKTVWASTVTEPTAMTTDGAGLFVAGYAATQGSLSEFNASTGALVETTTGSPLGFERPDALATAGPNLFVANNDMGLGDPGANSISEVDIATGALVRAISGPRYRLTGPDAMVVTGPSLTGPASPGTSKALTTTSLAPAGRAGPGPAGSTGTATTTSAPGPDLFVANTAASATTLAGVAGSVTEVNASTGALVRVISGPSYDLADPVALALVGLDLFVANDCCPGAPCPGPMGAHCTGTVTEINASTGALVAVLQGAADGFDNPIALVPAGPDLFIVGGSIVEVNAATRAVVWTAPSSKYGFAYPTGVALDGPDMFVADEAGGVLGKGALTELNTSTGAVLRQINGPVGTFDQPVGITSDNGYIFVLDQTYGYYGAVTELNASTASVTRVVENPAYRFDHPDAIIADGPDLFVANQAGDSVTELSS